MGITGTDRTTLTLSPSLHMTVRSRKRNFIRVQVTNVNEPPEFDEGPTATRDVAADAEVNDLVGDAIEATDPDNDFLTYRLAATPAPPFQIDEYTGQLSVSGAIDQNTASYTMTVFVSDGAGRRRQMVTPSTMTGSR